MVLFVKMVMTAVTIERIRTFTYYKFPELSNFIFNVEYNLVARQTLRIGCTKSHTRHSEFAQNRAGFLCQPESCC
jgi:hypothetical protein